MSLKSPKKCLKIFSQTLCDAINSSRVSALLKHITHETPDVITIQKAPRNLYETLLRDVADLGYSRYFSIEERLQPIGNMFFISKALLNTVNVTVHTCTAFSVPTYSYSSLTIDVEETEPITIVSLYLPSNPVDRKKCMMQLQKEVHSRTIFCVILLFVHLKETFQYVKA